MTKLEQAARQALETLERASDAGYSVECDETVTALREALEQAAPRAAPGEPFDECFPGEPRVAVPQGLIGAACFAIRNKRDGGKVLEQLRRYSVGDLSQPLAPQQEAQEPVAWLNPWRADKVTTDYDAYGERGIPLYTAPQPAPLSEQDPLQGAANWLAQAHGMFCTAVLQSCLMIGYNRAKRLHDAALAAQGGKEWST